MEKVLVHWLLNKSGIKELEGCIKSGCDSKETFLNSSEVTNDPDLYNPKTDTYYEVVSIFTNYLKENRAIHFRDNKLVHLKQLSETKNIKIIVVDIINKAYRIIDMKDIEISPYAYHDQTARFCFSISMFGGKTGHRMFLDYDKFILLERVSLVNVGEVDHYNGMRLKQYTYKIT